MKSLTNEEIKELLNKLSEILKDNDRLDYLIKKDTQRIDYGETRTSYAVVIEFESE